ncbi:PQQ-binding-like beta-propeller repeat protein [bacterium]
MISKLIHHRLNRILLPLALLNVSILLSSCSPFFHTTPHETVTWPSFRGHPHNLGFHPVNIYPPLIMDWVFPIQPTVIRSTAAATQNALFLPDWNGRIWKINAVTGRSEFCFQTPSLMTASPAIDEKRLYIGGCDSIFYAFDINQRKFLWRYSLNHLTVSSPQIDEHSVYFGAHDLNFYCLNKKTGRLRWKKETKGLIPSSPAIDQHFVYFSTADSMVYCMEKKKGHLVWVTSLNHNTWASPVILDTLVYIGDIEGNLYALNRQDGQIQWKQRLYKDRDTLKKENESHKSLIVISTVATDLKHLFVNTSDGQIIALHPVTGNILWRTETQDQIYAPPLVSPDFLYVTTMSEHLYVINKHTGVIDQTITVTGPVYASPVICGDRLCFGTEKGLFYAYHIDRNRINNP